jgi:hypothetical protein
LSGKLALFGIFSPNIGIKDSNEYSFNAEWSSGHKKANVFEKKRFLGKLKPKNNQKSKNHIQF